MNTSQQIAEIFSHLHDGGITAWRGDYKKLTLTVEILYLAEQIDPGFENFYVELYDIETFEIEPWGKGKTTFTNFNRHKDLFINEIEINAAEEKDGFAVITYHNNDFPTTGGYLYIKAGGIRLYRQDRQEIAPEIFTEISNLYWRAFEKK